MVMDNFHCVKCGAPINLEDYEEMITFQDDGIGFARIATYECWQCGYNNKSRGNDA